MRYFYDTEFLEDGKTIDLISIGIVADDGREYYAVNVDCDWPRIRQDAWMMENVAPHLPTREVVADGSVFTVNLDRTSALVKPKWVIANEVRDFLLQQTETQKTILEEARPELWAYYGAYDHVALAQLWGKMINIPKGIPMWTHDLMTLVKQYPGLPKRMPNPAKHDALADARWNRDLYRAAIESGGKF